MKEEKKKKKKMCICLDTRHIQIRTFQIHLPLLLDSCPGIWDDYK